MAMHNMAAELNFLKENGYTQEQLEEKFNLQNWDMKSGKVAVSNKSQKRQVEALVAEVKAEEKKASFRAAKQGDASAYKEPFFTKGNDGEWVVVARGIDFIESMSGAPAVRVRKRNGSVSQVEVIESVDKTSDKIHTWSIQ